MEAEHGEMHQDLEKLQDFIEKWTLMQMVRASGKYSQVSRRQDPLRNLDLSDMGANAPAMAAAAPRPEVMQREVEEAAKELSKPRKRAKKVDLPAKLRVFQSLKEK